MDEAVTLARRHPTYRYIDSSLLPLTLERLGDFHRDGSHHEAACTAYQSVRDFWRTSELEPSEPDTKLLARVLLSQHKSLALLNQYEEAEVAIQQAVNVERELHSGDPQPHIYVFAETLREYGSFLRNHHRFDEALEVQQEGITLLQRNGKPYSYELAISFSEHALTLQKLGQLKKAYNVIEKAIEFLRGSDRSDDLGRALRRYGLLLRTMKQHGKAAKLFEEACKAGLNWVEQKREKFNDCPKRYERHKLAEALQEYSTSLRLCKRVREADEMYEESIELGYKPTYSIPSDELGFDGGEGDYVSGDEDCSSSEDEDE